MTVTTTASSSPNEVVTKALLRLVERARPGPAGRADHAGQRLRPHQAEHASARADWRSLDAAITAALAADPAFIAVTGKPYIFCVGADITGMPLHHGPGRRRWRSAGSATGSSRGCATAPVPTFAFVNGAAHGRRPGAGAALPLPDAVRPARRRSRCPRSSLGLVPGWGGTQLLPNLIGIAGAAAGHHRRTRCSRTRCSSRAGRSSWASPTCCSSRPTSWSGRWSGPPAWSRGEVTVDAAARSTGTCGTASSTSPGAMLDERLHGAVPAAYRALDCSRWPRTRRSPSGTGRRGRGARRPDHARGAARRPLRVRPGAAPGQAPGRRARQGPGPRRSPRSASSAPA